MKMLLIDFETRSRVNLKTRGADVYAADPSTDILCCGFGMYGEDQPKTIWWPNTPLPLWVAEWICGGGLIAAHNARFDALIWDFCGERAGLPLIKPTRWYCTSAQCRVNALPASLDDAAKALGLKKRKDHKGEALIRQLSIPRADGTFNEDPALMQMMGEYCVQDIKVMHAVMRSTRLMTATEHQDWLVSERINDRGILIDDYLAELAIGYADEEQHEISAVLSSLTDGVITKHTQTIKAKDWMLRRLPDHQKKHLYKHVKGEKKSTLDKNARGMLLECGDLDWTFRQLVEHIDAGNKSSVSKFKQMLGRRDEQDGRVRGAFVYAGATQTLRYTSRGLQLHNMRRECLNPTETEDTIDLMENHRRIDLGGRSTMDTLSMMLRPALVPEHKNVFVVGDWSSIEARALPWLANSPEAETVLDLFRNGEDIYTYTAKSIGQKDRQVGKVATLSLGFAGGVGAFDAMAANYGVHLDEQTKANVVQGWREANRWAVRFWSQVERAAFAAVRTPNTEHSAGRVKYIFIDSLMGGTLICILPSNQMIQYPQARVEMLPPSYDLDAAPVPTLTALKANLTMGAEAKEWPRASLWKGLLVENICQAVCADLLRCTLRKLDKKGLPVVAHVHDEVVVETKSIKGRSVSRQLQKVMETTPEWAEGLPLNAEPAIMVRYGK